MHRTSIAIATATLLAVALAACGGGDAAPSTAPASVHEVASARIPANKLPQCALPAATAPLTAITSVQGPGAASPIVGQTVTVRGVVTADWRGSARMPEPAPTPCACAWPRALARPPNW